MRIVLEDERLKNYARTDDAVVAFNSAVNNGQARLALEILVPIIEQLASADNVDTPGAENSSEEVDVKNEDVEPTEVKSTTKNQASSRTVKKAAAKVAPKDSEEAASE